MPNRAALLRAAFLAAHPGSSVVGRGRRHLKWQLAAARFAACYTGPLHKLDGVTEIDTTITADTGAWQWKVSGTDFQWHARSVFNAGNIAEWRVGSEWVIFDPQSINWVDENSSRQQIAIKQAITGQVADNMLSFPAGYGAGRHFRYIVQPERLHKLITIDAAANLPAPTPTGNTIWFEAEFSLSTSAGVDFYLDGVRWAKTNNVRVKTANRIEIRDAATGTQVLWVLDFPRANDTLGNETIGEYEVRRQGGASNLFITVRIPRAWILTAQFPIEIDPTLDLNVSANDDDAMETANDTGFTATGTTIDFRSNTTTATSNHGAFRVVPTSGPTHGDTINTCYASFTCPNASVDDVDQNLHFENVDAAANFTTTADIHNRARTTAFVNWLADSLGTAEVNTPSLVTPFQEVIDRAGYASGNAVMLLGIAKTRASDKDYRWAALEHATLAPAALFIDWTAAGGSDPFPAWADRKPVNTLLRL